jgi:hypothetical protein
MQINKTRYSLFAIQTIPIQNPLFAIRYSGIDIENVAQEEEMHYSNQGKGGPAAPPRPHLGRANANPPRH